MEALSWRIAEDDDDYLDGFSLNSLGNSEKDDGHPEVDSALPGLAGPAPGNPPAAGGVLGGGEGSRGGVRRQLEEEEGVPEGGLPGLGANRGGVAEGSGRPEGQPEEGNGTGEQGGPSLQERLIRSCVPHHKVAAFCWSVIRHIVPQVNSWP